MITIPVPVHWVCERKRRNPLALTSETAGILKDPQWFYIIRIHFVPLFFLPVYILSFMSQM